MSSLHTALTADRLTPDSPAWVLTRANDAAATVGMLDEHLGGETKRLLGPVLFERIDSDLGLLRDHGFDHPRAAQDFTAMMTSPRGIERPQRRPRQGRRRPRRPLGEMGFIVAAGVVTCPFRNTVGSLDEMERVAAVAGHPVGSTAHNQSVGLLTQRGRRSRPRSTATSSPATPTRPNISWATTPLAPGRSEWQFRPSTSRSSSSARARSTGPSPRHIALEGI